MASRSPYHAVADLVNKLISTSSYEKDKHSNHSSSHKSTIKSLVYDKNGNLTCTPTTYALVCKINDNKQLLQQIATSISSKIQVKNEGLLLVLLFELLLSSNQSIKGGGSLKRMIIENEPKLRETLQKLLPTKTIVDAAADIKKIEYLFPRYVRINTYNHDDQTVQQIIQRMQQKLTTNIPITVDQHIPDLLVLPHDATGSLLKHHTHNKQENQLYIHDIILQDKSSCFPAYCLVYGYPDNSNNNEQTKTVTTDYIDACAAPGNKTSHLAALLSKKSRQTNTNTPLAIDDEKVSVGTTTSTTKIYAFDRDQKRFTLLKKRMDELVPFQNNNDGNTIQAIPQHQDFLATNPSDYQNVQAILLDPSCSGSGIVTSSDRHLTTLDNTNELDEHMNINNSTLKSRLERLSGFQITVLRHAMSFPNVNRIVYSTCSINVEENEHVVAAVLSGAITLKDDNDYDAAAGQETTYRSQWEVIAPTCLSNWNRRGQAVRITDNAEDNAAPRRDVDAYITEEEAACMITVDPNQDETNGFFVCCLQRKEKPCDFRNIRNSEGTLSPKPRKKNKKDIEMNVNTHISLPVYQKGMFLGTTKNPTEAKFSSRSKDDEKRNDSDKQKKQNPTNASTSISIVKKNVQKESKKRSFDDVAAKATTTTTESKQHGSCKKRAKRLEWKARQHQQKVDRIKQKKNTGSKEQDPPK